MTINRAIRTNNKYELNGYSCEVGTLSNCEAQVMVYSVQGLKNKEVCEPMGIKANSVKKYWSNIFYKLDVDCVAMALIAAIQKSILLLPCILIFISMFSVDDIARARRPGGRPARSGRASRSARKTFSIC